MTKSNDGWVPEIGDKILIEGVEDFSRVRDFDGHEVTVDAVFEALGQTCISFHHPMQGLGTSTLLCVKKIKTEAEKRRELAVEELFQKLYADDSNDIRTVAENIIDAGWIKPKPLTFDVVKQIWFEANSEVMESPPQIKFAKAIEAYIRGELEL